MNQRAFKLSEESVDASARTRRGPIRGLVFVGLQVQWRRRIGDLELHTRLAEKWESAFDHWSIDGRNVHLGHGGIGYELNLSDGSAQIAVESPRLVLRQAQEHARQLIASLVEAGRDQLVVHGHAQYLDPVEDTTFADLMNTMVPKLLNPEFAGRIGAEHLDVAYLADLAVEGQWFQVNAGPVRAHEIPKRVVTAPRRLGKIPELARFWSVTSRAPVDLASFDLETFWRRIFRVGDSITQELTDDHARTELAD